MNMTPVGYLRALFTGWLGSISTLVTGLALLTWLLQPFSVLDYIPERALVALALLSFLLANFIFYARSQLPGQSVPETFKRLDEVEETLPAGSEPETETEVGGTQDDSEGIRLPPPPARLEPSFQIDGSWWMRDWSHENDSDARRATTFSDNATLDQNGARVTGRFTNQDGTYEIEGEIRGWRIFVGEWREVITDGRPRPIWYGFFMFRIFYDRTEPTMLGRWVGVTSDQEGVKCGIWEWCRPGKTFPTERGDQKYTWLRRLLS